MNKAIMSVAKIAISINSDLLQQLDEYIKHNIFKNRSQAVQVAISTTIDRLGHKRLEQECKKLNIKTEQALANEGLTEELDIWPLF